MSVFKKQLTIQIVIASVAVVLFGLFLYLFRANITHQVMLIGQVRANQAILSTSAENLSLLINDWGVAQQYMQQVETLVPHKDELVALSKDFDALARQHNVSLSFSFGEEQNPKNAKELGSIGFTANLGGSMNAITTFLSELEGRYYAMKIDTLDFTFNEGAQRYDVFMRGKLFFTIES